MQNLKNVSPDKESISDQHKSVEGKLPVQGLTGWYCRNSKNANSQINVRLMEEALDTSIPTSQIQQDRFAVSATSDLISFGDSAVAAIIGRPYWRTDALAAVAESRGNAAALVEAYIENHENLTEMIWGNFVFLVIDPNQDTFIIGTDRMGTLPLYYVMTDSMIIFGTNAKSVIASDCINAEIELQGIYDYVYFHMVPSPSTVYRDINKLCTGHCIYQRQADTRIAQYWRPAFKRRKNNDFKEMGETLRQLLKESVQRRLPENVRPGAFLSGGLDSSTITGILSELTDGRAKAYSIGFAADGYDEMAYARITARHFDVELHEYYVTPENIVEALPDIATSYDEPFGNSSALPAWFCAKLAAEDGVDLLLAGDGGDELFGGNERYGKQKLFELYRLVPLSAKRNLIEPMIRMTPNGIPFAEKACSYIEQANIPLPNRLQSYNFLHRHNPNEVFTKEFLASIDKDYPLDLQRAVYNSPEDASTLDRMLYLDWQFTLADNDLRKVTQTCALAGIQVAYPMLDDALVEFSCNLPDDWKLKRQKLRYFYKKSLQNWLPDETITKSKKGFGLPFGIWLKSHKPLQELAYENLQSLSNRNIFNTSFISNAMEMHKNNVASYYGELIWILTVLEIWMKKNCSSMT